MDKKSGIIALVALVIIVGGVFGVMALNKDGGEMSNSSSSSNEDKDKSSSASENSATSEKQVDMTDKKEVAVGIVDFDFSEKNIKIKKGTTVTWTNNGDVEHNAQKDGVGETYSFTFSEAGEFPYHCAPHSDSMMANITVV